MNEQKLLKVNASLGDARQNKNTWANRQVIGTHMKDLVEPGQADHVVCGAGQI